VSDAGSATDREALFAWVRDNHDDCNAVSAPEIERESERERERERVRAILTPKSYTLNTTP